MKLKQFLGIFWAACLLAAVQPAAAAVFVSSFTGDADPANWTAYQGNPANPGSYTFSSDGSSLQLSASANPSASEITLTLNLTESISMNIAWVLAAGQTIGGDATASYSIDGGAVQGFTVGSANPLYLTANSTITFDLSSPGTVAGKTPATFNISFAPVPEPGTWSVLGGILLGGVYLVFAVVKQIRLRRNQPN